MTGIDIGTLKNILAAMGAELPSAKEPTNKVAEFVDREVTTLMPDDPDIVDIFKGVYVGAANADPNKVLGVLIRVHKDIGELVKDLQDLQKSQEVVEIIVDNLPDKEEEEEEEEEEIEEPKEAE